MYECIRCNYNTKNKTTFKNHLLRKRLCDNNNNNDINKDDLLKNYLNLFPELEELIDIKEEFKEPIKESIIIKEVKFKKEVRIKSKSKSKEKEKKKVEIINFGDEIYENILSEDDIIYILNKKKEWIQEFVRITYCGYDYPEMNTLQVNSLNGNNMKYYKNKFISGPKDTIIETLIKNIINFLDRMMVQYAEEVEQKTLELLIERVNSYKEEAGVKEDYSWCFGLKDELLEIINEFTIQNQFNL